MSSLHLKIKESCFFHLNNLLLLLVFRDAAVNSDESNPDGSCTNPKFRWFDSLSAFYNYTNNNFTIPAVRINISLNTNARCLDGSQYMFYYRNGFDDGINKYQIYLQGGGWCYSYESCYQRSLNNGNTGSSINYTKYAWYSNEYLSDNYTINPLMYNWNTIWIIYCDGSSFTGNNITIYSYNNTNLYFRGYINLYETMKYLYYKKGLNNATDIVLSGCSAGGNAVFINNNFIYNNFILKTINNNNNNNNINFMSIAHSGFFPYNNPISNDSDWYKEFEWIYQTQNVSNILDKNCVKYYENTLIQVVYIACLHNIFHHLYYQIKYLHYNQFMIELELDNNE